MVVGEGEGVEGYAVLGEEGKIVILGVVGECGGEEAAGGGDERRGGAVGFDGGDEAAVEDAIGEGYVEGGI